MIFIVRNGRRVMLKGGEPPEHAFTKRDYHCMVCHCDECRNELPENRTFQCRRTGLVYRRVVETTEGRQK